MDSEVSEVLNSDQHRWAKDKDKSFLDDEMMFPLSKSEGGVSPRNKDREKVRQWRRSHLEMM